MLALNAGQPAVYQMRSLLARGAPQGFEGGGTPGGQWAQVASQSHVNYSSQSYATSMSTENRQFHAHGHVTDNGGSVDMWELQETIKRTIRGEMQGSAWG